MKVVERNKAIKLRRQGKTYFEIQKILPVSKGTLSYWLRDIELTKEHLRRIYKKNLEIRQRFIEYNQIKRKEAIDRKNHIARLSRSEIKRVSKQELKLVGSALYWAEGSKENTRGGMVGFVNSDPIMIKLIMRWFREICLVPESKFRLRVQIHDHKRVKTIERYWSRLTRVPLRQFTAPTLRVSKTSQRKRGIILPYGVLSIRISDIRLLSKISGWIQGLGASSSSPV